MNLKGKQVLVTGADGFIGSHLTELLLERGARVRALSYYNSFNHWGWLEDVPACDNFEVISGDIRDPYFCKCMMSGVHTVFHLAALIAIPYSYRAPASYVDTNVNGTLNVMQAALDAGCERVVHTSTSEVYGTACYVPIDEGHPLQAQSPYSASKIGADAIATSFHRSFGLPVIIARPFNTYGPRQSARAVITTIIVQILNGCSSIQLGDLTPTRDFNYVLDTCNGFVALAQSDNAVGEVVNIGSNSEVSIGDVLDLIRRLMKSDIEFKVDPERLRPKTSEVFRLRCENLKMRELTGFTPAFSLEEGLMETIEWFRNTDNFQRYKSHLYNL